LRPWSAVGLRRDRQTREQQRGSSVCPKHLSRFAWRWTKRSPSRGRGIVGEGGCRRLDRAREGRIWPEGVPCGEFWGRDTEPRNIGATPVRGDCFERWRERSCRRAWASQRAFGVESVRATSVIARAIEDSVRKQQGRNPSSVVGRRVGKRYSGSTPVKAEGDLTLE